MKITHIEPIRASIPFELGATTRAIHPKLPQGFTITIDDKGPRN